MKMFVQLIGVCAVFCCGCAQKNPVSSQAVSAQSVVAVSLSYDYNSGNVGVYSISDSVTYQNLLPSWNDNDVRTHDGAIYVLLRYGKDNLLKIRGSVIADSTVVYEKNIGASVNIQDIAFISPTKAYITQYGSSQVAIIDPTTGSKYSRTIDLSRFNTYAGTAEADNVPYMSRELYHNGKVYVACQRLKNFTVADTSVIVVINATTDSVEKSINLIYKNPQELSICDGKLYVASVGRWGVMDGGIEAIDLTTNTSIGSVVADSAILGDVVSIIALSASKGYAVISMPDFTTTELHAFNPLTKTMGPKITGLDAPCNGHMVYNGTYVFVGDRSRSNPGIVIVDPLTDAKNGTTKNIGLPPNSLALLTITR